MFVSMLALALALPARAQDSASSYLGEIVRLRIHGGENYYVGRLMAVREDSLVLAPRDRMEPTVSIARKKVARMWVSAGSSPRTGEGAITGLIVGGILGALVGAGLEDPPCGPNELFCFDMQGLTTMMGAAAGVTGGVLVGGMLGRRSFRENWRPLDLGSMVMVVPVTRERFGLALRVPLGGR